MASEQMRAFLDAMRNAPPKNQVKPTEESRKGLDAYMSTQPVAEGFTAEDFTLANCAARRYLPTGSDTQGVILYLHGGGYYTGSPDSHHALMSHLCVACRAVVVGLAYRLAPEHPYPAALNDAMATFRDLAANTAPSQIMIAGDSAGGGLTTACLQALRDTSGPIPGCAALLSPSVDLSETGARFGDVEVSQSARYYAGSHPMDHPGISPVFGEMHDLPPILVQVASDEPFIDETTRLVNKLVTAGVTVEFQSIDEAFHVFQMFTELPESSDAINRIAKFYQQHVAKQA